MNRDGPEILVIGDSEAVRDRIGEILGDRGFRVPRTVALRGVSAEIVEGTPPAGVVVDMNAPNATAWALIEGIRRLGPDLPVVVLSSDARASTIVETVRRGADDYLTKPPNSDELEVSLRGLLADRALLREQEDLRDNPHATATWDGPSMGPILETIERIADTDVTVLIQGESGVGKEVVARRVHAASTRHGGPFVKVNCAALPGELLESELFGYEKGAFTGAVARKPGKFEQASGGTIFLDEIGEMNPAAQAKLLHVLQDGAFTRLGGNHEISADVRVVSATNRPLDRGVEKGTFREDLYFRLNVVALHLPPLRDRVEEFDGLVANLLARSAARYRKTAPVLSQTLMEHLRAHPFPGNVRELENYLKRIVVLETEAPVIEDLHRASRRKTRSVGLTEMIEEAESTAGQVPLRDVGRRAAALAEHAAIQHALDRTSWNRRRAAEILGVSYKTLLSKIRSSGLVDEP